VFNDSGAICSTLVVLIRPLGRQRVKIDPIPETSFRKTPFEVAFFACNAK